MSLWGPQILGAPRLSLVRLVGNRPLVGGPQIGESISLIKGMKKELLQKTASYVRNFPCQTLKISKVSLVVMGS